MQRPPRPILLSRPISEAINRVSRLHRKLAELNLSTEQQRRLTSWIETHFVCSTLALAGAQHERSRVATLIDSAGPETAPGSSEDRALLELVGGLRKTLALVQKKGGSASLTTELLFSFHIGAELRKGAGEVIHGITPIGAERIHSSIEAACAWFAAESFAELNPIEQASIAYLRLLEIQPLETNPSFVASIAASFFTLRAGLPPIILEPDQVVSYGRALEEGARMNTQPMVELVAVALERTLTEMIELMADG